MAEFNQSSDLIPYNQIQQSQLRWTDFFFAELSSIYNDTAIKSANYATIIREYARIAAISEILFDQTVEDNVLELVRQRLLFQNFGYLIKERPAGFSPEEYRSFLLTLVDLIFKGLSINVASNEAASSLGINNIKVFSPTQLRNTSFLSHGLDHLNSLTNTLNQTTALVLDQPSETSLDLTSRDRNKIIICSPVDDNGDFHIDDMNILTEVITLISSAIVDVEVRVLNSDSAQITSSSSESIFRRQSFDNFATLDTLIQYHPTFTIFFITEFVFPEDIYDLTTNLIDLVPTVHVDRAYEITDSYNLIPATLPIVGQMVVNSFIVGQPSDGIIDYFTVDGVTASYTSSFTYGDSFVGDYSFWPPTP